MSFPSRNIGMPDIHTFVTGISSPLPPLKMMGFCHVLAMSAAGKWYRLSTTHFRQLCWEDTHAKVLVFPVPPVSSPLHHFLLLGRVLKCRTSNRHQKNWFNRHVDNSSQQHVPSLTVHITEESKDEERKFTPKISPKLSSPEFTNCLHQPSARRLNVVQHPNKKTNLEM